MKKDKFSKQKRHFLTVTEVVFFWRNKLTINIFKIIICPRNFFSFSKIQIFRY